MFEFIKQHLEQDGVTSTLREREVAAIKNLIFATKERLWLSDFYPRTPDAHLDYSGDLTEDKQRILQESIKEVDTLLRRNEE